MGERPFVQLLHIEKSFPGVLALQNASIDFYRGRIHVLMGENGAGKSTIIKIISGVYQADKGVLKVGGKEERFMNTRESLAKGISIIHQELSVIPDLTIAENIYLGREPRTPLHFIDKAKMNRDTEELLRSMGLNLKPTAIIRKLNNGEKQMVEIARAVSQNSSLVIMDEPTSSLSEHEANALFRVIKKLKNENVAVIYISHRIKEILELGDDITILRDGAVVTTVPIHQITEQEMIHKMVGREIKQFYYKAANAVKEKPVLSVKGLTRKGHFEDVSFSLYEGEILGISGLVGAGRTEVMRGIYGADKIEHGEVTLFGTVGIPKSCKEAVDLGIGLIPEDRRLQGLLLDKDITMNTTLASLYKNSFRGFINFKWERRAVREYIDKMSTKTPSETTLIRNLSGGNQQKVIISRWLLADVKILIMDEPTRGIDLNAKAEIYERMKEFVEQGGSILMVSSDLPEVLGISDRIMVMRNGRISGFLNQEEASERAIMKLASMNTNVK